MHAGREGTSGPRCAQCALRIMRSVACVRPATRRDAVSKWTDMLDATLTCSESRMFGGLPFGPFIIQTQGSDPRAKLLLPRLNLIALISLDSRPIDVCLQMRPKAMLSRSVFTLAMLRTLAATPSQYTLMEILYL